VGRIYSRWTARHLPRVVCSGEAEAEHRSSANPKTPTHPGPDSGFRTAIEPGSSSSDAQTGAYPNPCACSRATERYSAKPSSSTQFSYLFIYLFPRITKPRHSTHLKHKRPSNWNSQKEISYPSRSRFKERSGGAEASRMEGKVSSRRPTWN